MQPARDLMLKKLANAWALVMLFVTATTVSACPLCESSTGQQVRAGIFNEDFAGHSLGALLPFGLLLTIVAWIHFGLPPWRKPKHPM